MNRRKDNNSKRNADIFAEYVELFKCNELRISAIYDRLAAKYYLNRTTLERIVWKAKREQEASETASGVP